MPVESHNFCLVFILRDWCLLNPVFRCHIYIDLTFLPSGSPWRLLILVKSDEVQLRPESPLVPVPPNSPFPAPSRQTSPSALDTGRGMLVFHLLNIEGSLALDLLIAAFAVCVFAFAISGGETILVVRFGVFRALEGVMTFAATP